MNILVFLQFFKKISLIKTVVFNVRYIGLKSLFKCPVYVGKNVILESLSGTVKINEPLRRGMVFIGITNNSIQDKKFQRCEWNNKGHVIFDGSANIGCGTKIYCMDSGVLHIGNHFSVNGNTEIICTNYILFGDDCNISWDCLFMDSDFHTIIRNGQIVNPNKPIKIGKHVWFGCRCTVLKGSSIAENCVVAANSCITHPIVSKDCVIGRNGDILKNNVTWKMEMPGTVTQIE